MSAYAVNIPLNMASVKQLVVILLTCSALICNATKYTDSLDIVLPGFNDASPNEPLYSTVTRVNVSGVFGSIGGRARNFSGVNGDIYTMQLRDPYVARNASFWHDIPWRPSTSVSKELQKFQQDEFWFVCEIPRGTCAKMETMTSKCRFIS